jgi:hypothetical protein
MDGLWRAMLAGLVLLMLLVPATASAATDLKIASPAEGTPTITEESTLTPSGTTSGSEPVSVEIVHEENSVETLGTMLSEGAWKAEQSEPLPNGTYTVVARQSDPGEGEGASPVTASATVTIARPPPHVTLNPLAEVVGTATPGFGGEATPDDGQVALKIYRGTAGAGELAQTLKASPGGGTWSVGASKPLQDGTYTAVAEQSDNAGNLGKSAPSTFTVKTTGPTVSLTPVGSPSRNVTPSFSGRAETEVWDELSVTVRVYAGTAAVGTPVQSLPPATVIGGMWSAGPTEGLPDGVYTAIAEQSDGAHNVGKSVASTFVVDTMAPAVSLSGPPASIGAETVSGTAGTAVGDLPAITVQVFSGASPAGQPVETVIVNAGGGSWSATLAGLGSGTYSARAAQSDEAGNTGTSADITFTVTAPGATISTPSAPTASFTWVPASPRVGESVSLVSNSTPGSSAIGAFAWDVAGSGQFVPGASVITTSFATVGAHVVHLRATGANGLSGVATKTITVGPPTAKLMQPFPIVRIAGAETSNGVKVRLLTVQAPLSTKVVVSCAGPGCKTKSESRTATASAKSKLKAGAVMLTFKRFERTLRAGVVLQIRVTKAGQIGKFTTFKIRRHKLPLRSDACLRPASSAPSACPVS